ncbi:MAG: glycosyltransferase family 39 protein [Usitatibacter sp.]
MSATAAPQPRLSFNKLAMLLALVFAVLAGSAMLRTSVTFDEVIFSAVGARGFATGDFTMVNDHPRLAQYMYGIPAYLTADRFPSEETSNWNWYSRYHYARALLWGVGNFPERIIMSTRLVALIFGTLTVLGTYWLTRRSLGAGTALLAAALLAFLPDLLAQSGVAYNDVPLAFGLLVSVFALDAAVRDLRPGRVAVAAFACALTLCVKYSAVVLGPILVAMLLCEALSGRARDAAWRRALTLAVPLFAVIVYLTIALLYLGDWRLADFFSGLREITRSSLAGRPAFLLGERNIGGWWYFFPVAFALKTPVALHVFMLVALVAGWRVVRGGRWREWLIHAARPAVLGAGLFLGALLASRVNIGVRHALPMMPFLCILLALGVAQVASAGQKATRLALGAVFATYVLSTVTHYPFFLSYLSDYSRGRALHETLVDSSTDWGQGLVALRSFMRERGIEEVALAYFGSALPEGYGIRYVPLPSFLELPPAQSASSPRYLVISATLLTGNYAKGDPYAQLRTVKPMAVVAETMYVFDRMNLVPR